MRLFIAIRFDSEITTALKQLQASLKDCGLKGRYSSEENLHLTLAFIGEYGNPEKVVDAMKAVEFEEFPVEFFGFGHFGIYHWVGIEENPYLMSYVKRLRSSLRENGIPFDSKKFKPHITLARRGRFMDGKVRYPDKIPEIKTTVRSVALIKSEQGKDGSIYTVLGEVKCTE